MLSGPWDLAELFKKPKLGINIYDCSVGLAFNEGDRLVLKHAYSHRNNRKLNLQEFLSADTDLHNIYGEVSNKYSLIENTAEEIETAIENFCELIDSRSFAPSSEQTAISAFWRHHALDRIDLGTYFLGMPAHQRVAECERFKAKTEMANLFLDPTYIEENWNLQE